MKTKNIVLISVVVLIAITLITVVGMYFSYNNREINLRQQAEAQRGKIEAVYDRVWKIISQKAQVADQYKDAFAEIYPELIAGRYENDNNSLMKWIQESNPNFDTSLYKDLMQSIEIERHSFTKSQERMLDIIREHKVLCETYPGTWFVSNKSPIDFEVISSTKTKYIMDTGLEDDIDLFNK